MKQLIVRPHWRSQQVENVWRCCAFIIIIILIIIMIIIIIWCSSGSEHCSHAACSCLSKFICAEPNCSVLYLCFSPLFTVTLQRLSVFLSLRLCFQARVKKKKFEVLSCAPGAALSCDINVSHVCVDAHKHRRWDPSMFPAVQLSTLLQFTARSLFSSPRPPVLLETAHRQTSP